MKCASCSSPIRSEQGFFSTIINQETFTFHTNCKPVFFWYRNNPHDVRQRELELKEQK